MLVVAALAGTALASADAESKVVCPVQAPEAWGASRGALAGVEVLSARRGEKIDPAAPPSLMPDTNEIRGGMRHQIWQMNADGPDWVFYVDCHYAGTARVLRLDAGGVARCERILPASPNVSGPQSLTCE